MIDQPDRIKKAYVKVSRFCAMGERSPRQIKDKLSAFGLTESEASSILHELALQDFVNTARFAKAFANDKFRFNKWGKLKIAHEMRRHELSAEEINEGLRHISEEDYLIMIDGLIVEKWKSLGEQTDQLTRQAKTMRYLLQKGFEQGLVMAQLKNVISGTKI